MKTSFFAQSFSKILIIFSLSVTTLFALANNSVIDYQLQSTVYHWYGVLDKPELPIPMSADVDLKEYQNQQRVAGAHHILTITPVSQKKRHPNCRSRTGVFTERHIYNASSRSIRHSAVNY